MLARRKNDNGFTIVELLIVIVIIGVLASLVIVAYNGIQQRTRNTSRVAAAKEWQKVLNTYINQEGVYPYGSTACLGDGYPTDFDGNPDQDCHRTAVIRHPNSTLNSEILKVVTSLPVFPKDTVALVGGSFEGQRAIGLSYDPNTIVEGQTGRVKVHFWLEGTNQPCGVTVLDGLGNISSSPYTNGSYAGATLCSFTTDDPRNI